MDLHADYLFEISDPEGGVVSKFDVHKHRSFGGRRSSSAYARRHDAEKRKQGLNRPLDFIVNRKKSTTIRFKLPRDWTFQSMPLTFHAEKNRENYSTPKNKLWLEVEKRELILQIYGKREKETYCYSLNYIDPAGDPKTLDPIIRNGWDDPLLSGLVQGLFPLVIGALAVVGAVRVAQMAGIL